MNDRIETMCGHKTYKVVILINNLEKILSSIEVIHRWPACYPTHIHMSEKKEQQKSVILLSHMD